MAAAGRAETLCGGLAYLTGWDHDANLLDGLSEFLWFDGSVVVKIEILEGFEEDLFLALHAAGLLRQLVLKFFLETSQNRC